ncbi:hypothetical protein K449DRAFT_395967 [Hypoxylon sp. EC38]|nr:hypothetical protein K449DRAFT_395967 [Hypoxylon sp. EC38]
MDVVDEGEGGHEDQEGGMFNWEVWSMLIIDGEEVIIDILGPLPPPRAWTLDEKQRPFPLNLRPTWYCVALLVLILAVHTELDTTWLLSHGYTHYILRILSKTIHTIVISFFSTFLFEVAGRILSLVIGALIARFYLFLDLWFIERLHWGPVDEEGHALGLDIDPDPANLRQPIRHAVRGFGFLLFHYLIFVVLHNVHFDLGAYSILFVRFIATDDFANFISNLPTTLDLLTPGLDGVSSFRTLYWEFGVPALFQIGAAAFLFLCAFLCRSRSETPSIVRGEVPDFFYILMSALLRATAMHLLAYTAYQIVCIGISTTHPHGLLREIPESMMKGPILGRLMRIANVQFSPRAGILLIGAHWLVKSACRLVVEHVWPLWVPYMVWLSIKTEVGVWREWQSHSRTLNEDMELFNQDKAVLERVIMTTLFSLKSSWPVRMRLTTADGLDERRVEL